MPFHIISFVSFSPSLVFSSLFFHSFLLSRRVFTFSHVFFSGPMAPSCLHLFPNAACPPLACSPPVALPPWRVTSGWPSSVSTCPPPKEPRGFLGSPRRIRVATTLSRAQFPVYSRFVYSSLVLVLPDVFPQSYSTQMLDFSGLFIHLFRQRFNFSPEFFQLWPQDFLRFLPVELGPTFNVLLVILDHTLSVLGFLCAIIFPWTGFLSLSQILSLICGPGFK